ncbi:sensor histidine kinase [Streptomyces sp. NPDC091279]|uniref:sensor histidine kinase n=1 Tax=Streptomyces sp. NPDC091279 TaxID=3365983 RepID=UPI0038004D60
MKDPVRALPALSPRLVDVIVAVALFACAFPGSMITFPGSDLGVSWWPGALLAGVSCVIVTGRRRRPRTTVALTLLGAFVMSVLGYLPTVLLLGPLMVALYSLALVTDRRTANSFAVAAIAVLVGTSLVAGPAQEPLVLKLLGPAAWLLLPTSLGTVARLRSAYLVAERARAEHAERTREEEALRRVTEERLRIARDLHDVVAHHLVLANLQATLVTRQLATDPDRAADTATELAGSTSSALRELKSTVGLLRHAGSTDPPPEPTPGLARLPELAASFRPAGLTVTVRGEGEPRPLPAGADLTAYRIVQEALTNVTKHAATDTAEVRLTYLADRLVVTVTDDGTPTRDPGSPGPPPRAPDSPGPPPRAPGSPDPPDRCPGSGGPTPGSGYGLVGMRERARSAGGLLRVGPRPGGGFEVVAELPFDPGKNQLA